MTTATPSRGRPGEWRRVSAPARQFATPVANDGEQATIAIGAFVARVEAAAGQGLSTFEISAGALRQFSLCTLLSATGGWGPDCTSVRRAWIPLADLRQSTAAGPAWFQPRVKSPWQQASMLSRGPSTPKWA